MDYRLGNSKKVYEAGQTVELTCPKCEEKTVMSIFSNFDARLTAEFPLFKANNVYFLICPKCSGIFGLNENKKYKIKKNTALEITQDDLMDLKEFNV